MTKTALDSAALVICSLVQYNNSHGGERPLSIEVCNNIGVERRQALVSKVLQKI